MKKHLLIYVVFLGMISPQAQEIHRDVTGSAGGTDSINHILVSWTLGECIIENLCNSFCMVSQGFHQSYYKIFGLPENDGLFWNVRAYPNPTPDLLNIDLSGIPSGKTLKLTLLNTEGKALMQKDLSTSDTFRVHLKQFPYGLMILHILDPTTSSAISFKIIKVNQ